MITRAKVAVARAIGLGLTSVAVVVMLVSAARADEAELAPLPSLQRLVDRLDPKHVDGVGLAYISTQSAALFTVLAEYAKEPKSDDVVGLSGHFLACAEDFELVARYLALRERTQELSARNQQQREIEAVYRKEIEFHRSSGRGAFPPWIRVDHTAAMEVYPAAEKLAEFVRTSLK
jgi:hypothetical protein